MTHNARLKLKSVLESIAIGDRVQKFSNRRALCSLCATAARTVSIEATNAKLTINPEKWHEMTAEIHTLAGSSHVSGTDEASMLSEGEVTAWLIGKQRESDKTLASLVGKGTSKAVMVLASGIIYDKAAPAPKIGTTLDGK